SLLAELRPPDLRAVVQHDRNKEQPPSTNFGKCLLQLFDCIRFLPVVFRYKTNYSRCIIDVCIDPFSDFSKLQMVAVVIVVYFDILSYLQRKLVGKTLDPGVIFTCIAQKDFWKALHRPLAGLPDLSYCGRRRCESRKHAALKGPQRLFAPVDSLQTGAAPRSVTRDEAAPAGPDNPTHS